MKKLIFTSLLLIAAFQSSHAQDVTDNSVNATDNSTDNSTGKIKLL